MPNDKTDVKGRNDPRHTLAGLTAKDVGMVTDGVSLEKGYKVLGDVGRSPQAVAQNKIGKTPGARSY